MSDPYERADEDVSYVQVQRTIRKRVPDYEAELLLRHGWEEVPDE